MGKNQVTEEIKAVPRDASPDSHDATGESPKPTDIQPPRADGSDLWLWEIGGILGSALCLAGMAGLLLAYNDKPLPKWAMPREYSITLNTVLSILSTVSKICVLIPVTKGLGQLKWVWFSQKERDLSDIEKFESASRGITGSAMLLWKLRFRHFAALAAVAMVVSVAFDPFVQTLVKPRIKYTDQVPQPEMEAKLTVASRYETVRTRATQVAPLDPNMVSLVWQAIMDTSRSWQTPDYACITGNCTFPPILTLGVCSECTDVSDQLTVDCPENQSFNEDSTPTSFCNISLPNGFSLGGPAGYDTNVMAINTTSVSGLPPLVYKAGESTAISTVQSIFVLDNNLTDTDLFPINGSKFIQVPSYRASGDTRKYARECQLSPCVQAWKTHATTLASDETDLKNVKPLVTELLASFKNYTLIAEEQRVVFPRASLKLNGTEFANADQEFSFDISIYSAWRMLLDRHLQGFATADTTSGGQFTFGLVGGDQVRRSTDVASAYAAPLLEAMFTQSVTGWDYSGLCTETLLPDSLALSGDISCFAKKIAAAMTNGIRANAGLIKAMPGRTIFPVQWVYVQWYGFIVPVFLWLLSCTILIGTAIMSRKAGLRAWGTSPLPMVLLDVDADKRKAMEEHNISEKGLVKTAETLKLQLKVEDREVKLTSRE